MLRAPRLRRHLPEVRVHGLVGSKQYFGDSFPGPSLQHTSRRKTSAKDFVCMSRVAIDWVHPVFSHGQLSTASSRARVSTNCITVLLPESDFCTPNVVYQELLVHPITYNVARVLRLCCSVSCYLFQFQPRLATAGY
jgi:hypothetical protein